MMLISGFLSLLDLISLFAFVLPSCTFSPRFTSFNVFSSVYLWPLLFPLALLSSFASLLSAVDQSGSVGSGQPLVNAIRTDSALIGGTELFHQPFTFWPSKTCCRWGGCSARWSKLWTKWCSRQESTSNSFKTFLLCQHRLIQSEDWEGSIYNCVDGKRWDPGKSHLKLSIKRACLSAQRAARLIKSMQGRPANGKTFFFALILKSIE